MIGSVAMGECNADGSVFGTPEGIRVWADGDVFVVANSGGWVDGTFSTVKSAIEAAKIQP